MAEHSLPIDRNAAVAACPAACPRHAALKPVVVGVGWLVAAVGALGVAAIPYDSGESLCGVWGCFPPVQALAAMHLFWGVVLGAAVWAVRRWRPALLRPVGWVLLLAATATIAVVAGRDLPRWFEWLPAGDRHYWPRRVAYTLATTTDIPLVQSLAAGVICVVLGGRSAVRRAENPESCVGRAASIGTSDRANP